MLLRRTETQIGAVVTAGAGQKPTRLLISAPTILPPDISHRLCVMTLCWCSRPALGLFVFYSVSPSFRRVCSSMAMSKTAAKSFVFPKSIERSRKPEAPCSSRYTNISPGPLRKVVGTGAGGAGLVLEFMSRMATAGRAPAHPVTVAYACDSPALLRFVTAELLARKLLLISAPPVGAGIRVVTGLLEPSSFSQPGPPYSPSSWSSSSSSSSYLGEEDGKARRKQRRRQRQILGRLDLQVRARIAW